MKWSLDCAIYILYSAASPLNLMPFIFNIYGELATMCCIFFPHSPFIRYYIFLLSYH